MSRKQAVAVGQLFGLHWATVYRLRKQFLADPVVSALKRKPAGRKPGGQGLSDAVAGVIDQVFRSGLPKQGDLANQSLDTWLERGPALSPGPLV